MNDRYKEIGITIKTSSLEDATQLYIDELLNCMNDEDHQNYISNDFSNVLTDLFNTNNFTYDFPQKTFEEKFLIATTISVFAALRGINVLILTTRRKLDDKSLHLYFMLNPFTTKNTQNYVSVEERKRSMRTYPENIYISSNSTFRALYGKGVLICIGDISFKLRTEGRYSCNLPPGLTVNL